MTLLPGNRRMLVCLTLLLSGTHSAISAHLLTHSSRMQPGLSVEQKKKWDSIIGDFNRGIALHQAEKRSPSGDHSKSEKIFKKAASKLELFIKKYYVNKNDATYLRLQYRLGNMWEYANSDVKALYCYTVCSMHPLLAAQEIIYDGKPLAQQVSYRLKLVSQRQEEVKQYNARSEATDAALKASGGSKMGNDKATRELFLPMFPLPPAVSDLDPLFD